MQDALKRIDVSPLGAGAISGTTFNIDREMTKEALGFGDLYHNRIDADMDRVCMIETPSGIKPVRTRRSRILETRILWVGEEANVTTFVDPSMTVRLLRPESKDADIAELMRGKTGRTTGSLMYLLMHVK